MASVPETTDLLARLRLVAAWRKPGGPTPSEPMPSNYRTACDAVDEIERLRAGWLAMLASENECDASRRGACSAPDKCGCRREMGEWMNHAK